MADHISSKRSISASADRVWELVSDLPRMGELSNENSGGRWLGEAIGPTVGATFRGSNRNGIHRWSTKATVTDATPGELFAFDVSYVGIPISRWCYEIERSDGSCTVTEAWTDRRPGWFKPIAKLATGVGDRAEHTKTSIEETLTRLAAEAERSPK